jgi:hypothetical protein
MERFEVLQGTWEELAVHTNTFKGQQATWVGVQLIDETFKEDWEAPGMTDYDRYKETCDAP